MHFKVKSDIKLNIYIYIYIDAYLFKFQSYVKGIVIKDILPPTCNIIKGWTCHNF